MDLGISLRGAVSDTAAQATCPRRRGDRIAAFLLRCVRQLLALNCRRGRRLSRQRGEAATAVAASRGSY